MMRNCAPIFLLGIWLMVGAWFYVCKVKLLCNTDSTSPTTQVNTLEPVKDTVSSSFILSPTILKQVYQNVFEVEDDMNFQYSQDQIETGILFETGLDSIIAFLKKYPNTKLIITGYYEKEEQNPTSFSDLGLARADLIEQRLVGKGVRQDQMITISQATSTLFSSTTSPPNIVDFKFSERYDYLNEADIKEAYQALFFLEAHTQFHKNKEEILFRESPERAVETLQYYLNRNKSHSLMATVPFEEGEYLTTDTLNIGLVRAFDLKKQLVEMALNKKRVLINSQLATNIFDNFDLSLPEEVKYNFIFPDAHDAALQKELALERALSKSLSTEIAKVEINDLEEMEVVKMSDFEPKAAISKNDAPLQFNSGSYKLPVTRSIVDYVKELKAHLAENPDRQLLVIGHTDNKGDAEYNVELGRLRGYEARRLLINYNIPPSRIRVLSEGEYSPIADNQEEEGRGLNRRVDIDII